MKRLLLIGSILLGFGVNSAMAQSTDPYDDIYYDSKDAKKDAKKHVEPTREINSSQEKYDDGAAYNNSGNYDNSNTVGSDESEYSEYDSDDNSYAGNIRRFNNPVYGMGYYGSFYNPYWYDPYWGGWNTWYGGGWGMSIGMGYGYGGPYWSSGWGWSNWYGYPGFNSYWGSPYWGYGGCYGYGSYYNGYWNGYYAGLNGYGGYGVSRVVNYGPRYSANSIRNNSLNRPVANFNTGGRGLNQQRPNGLRTATYGTPGGTVRGNAVENNNIRGGVRTNDNNYNSGNNGIRPDRPVRGSFSTNDNAVGNPSPGGTRPVRSYGENNGGGRNVQPGQGVSPGIRSTPRSEGGGRIIDRGGNGGGRSYNSGNTGGGRSFGSGSSSGGGRSFGGSSSGGGRSSGSFGGARSMGGRR